MFHQRIFNRCRALGLARLLVLVVVVSVVIGSIPVSAQDTSSDGDSATELDSCTVIDESGEYVLTADVEDSNEATCISITASDVVLNGNGHTIDGVDADDAVGVQVGSFAGDEENITIRDLTVTDWRRGISNEDANEMTLTDIRAESNRVGISVQESVGHTLTDINASNNGGGLSFFFGGGSTFTDITANDNRGNGIDLSDEGNNQLQNVTANDNGGAGIVLGDSLTHRLSDVTTTGNEVGISLRLSWRNTIENATATNNTDWAFVSSGVFGTANETNRAENFTLDSATVSFVENKIGITAVEDPPADPNGLQNIGQYVNVTDVDEEAEGGVLLDVHYDDSDVPAGVDEDSLRLYQYANGDWEEVPDSAVDTDANVVSGNVTEFTDDSLVVAPLGQADGDDGGNGDDGVDEVFFEPITVEFSGITITFGPPTDLNGDGVYEDVTGDARIDVVDALAHAVVVTAVEQGAFDLTAEQADALDIDRDGDVDYADAVALLRENGHR